MFKTTFKIIIAVLLFINSATSCANGGHHIEVKVDGISDTTSYLAYHYGNRQYLKDTVDVDSEGRFAFTGNERIPAGMYMIVLPGQKYFEVIIDKNQHFEIATEMDRFVETMEFKGSPENTLFYEYISYLREKSREVAPIREKLNDPDISEEQRDSLQEKSKEVDKQVEARREEYIEEFPDCVFSLVLKAQQEVPMPTSTLGEDGTPDYDTSYQKYKKDFWQHIDFNDERIIRTPAYHSKLEHYFENVVIKKPDSVINEVDRIIDLAGKNDDMFQYTVWFLTNKYQRSQIMGMDAVFVHIVENYYKTGEVFWLNENQLNNIIERAERLKPILIGEVAPDIKMYKPDKSPLSLHDVEAKYTVIYFWDSECPHCKTKNPKLKDFYERFKDHGVEIFAVNTEADREKWLDYVEKNNLEDWINVHDPANKSGFRDKYDIYSIPLVFLLDENKKIIAKRINVEQLEDIITRQIEAR